MYCIFSCTKAREFFLLHSQTNSPFFELFVSPYFSIQKNILELEITFISILYWPIIAGKYSCANFHGPHDPTVPSPAATESPRSGGGRAGTSATGPPGPTPRIAPRAAPGVMMPLCFASSPGFYFRPRALILYPGIYPLNLFNSPRITSPPFRFSEIPSNSFFVECVASQVLAQQPPVGLFFEPAPPPLSSCEWFLLALSDVATHNVIWFDCFVQFTFSIPSRSLLSAPTRSPRQNVRCPSRD